MTAVRDISSNNTNQAIPSIEVLSKLDCLETLGFRCVWTFLTHLVKHEVNQNPTSFFGVITGWFLVTFECQNQAERHPFSSVQNETSASRRSWWTPSESGKQTKGDLF
jgi:hypothetical protein